MSSRAHEWIREQKRSWMTQPKTCSCLECDATEAYDGFFHRESSHLYSRILRFLRTMDREPISLTRILRELTHTMVLWFWEPKSAWLRSISLKVQRLKARFALSKGRSVRGKMIFHSPVTGMRGRAAEICLLSFSTFSDIYHRMCYSWPLRELAVESTCLVEGHRASGCVAVTSAPRECDVPVTESTGTSGSFLGPSAIGGS